MAVRNSIEVNVKSTESRTDALGIAQKTHAFLLNSTTTDDRVWSGKYTGVNDTTGVPIALNAPGSALGEASWTFASVTVLALKNLSATKHMLVGGAASNQFLGMVGATGDLIKVQPGGTLLFNAPSGCALAGAYSLLIKAESASTIDCEVMVIGKSA